MWTVSQAWVQAQEAQSTRVLGMSGLAQAQQATLQFGRFKLLNDLSAHR
jgi:hypothetical protein